jgi:hypothetical protein
MKDESELGLWSLVLGPCLWILAFILHPSSFILALVVGVGIEPTSRVFQTHANPSQLSNLTKNGLWSSVFSLRRAPSSEFQGLRPKAEGQRPTPKAHGLIALTARVELAHGRHGHRVHP